jgi:septin family protein
MYVWSKALAVALVVTLCGYGATALQAKDHKDQSCPKPQGCPAPVLQAPKVESSCCPMPTVQSHCGPPVQTGCCPVDPKDVSKAEKEALHAQHEAAEACKKRQEAIAKAQHELEEKTAKEQARIDRANDKLNQRASELQEANAKYESFYGGSSETAEK